MGGAVSAPPVVTSGASMGLLVVHGLAPLTFTGLSAFDKHRDGSHAKSTRHCVSPESVGLIEAGRAYPCWGFPGDPERQFAAAVGARITVEEQP